MPFFPPSSLPLLQLRPQAGVAPPEVQCIHRRDRLQHGAVRVPRRAVTVVGAEAQGAAIALVAAELLAWLSGSQCGLQHGYIIGCVD